MARGRPRQIRPEEFCPCCDNKGYSRVVRSWMPGYKLTTMGCYFRFRHDDRNFRCYKCGKKKGTKECYINKYFDNLPKTDFPEHPLHPVIEDIEHIAQVHKAMAKEISKVAEISKMWPASKDDKRGFELIEELRYLTDIYRLAVRMALYERKLMLEGKELSTNIKEHFNSIRRTNPILSKLGNDIIMIRVYLDYVYFVKFAPFRAYVKEMHAKYGIPQAMIRNKITKLKQQEAAFGTDKWDQ